jgi:hypothetical protein
VNREEMIDRLITGGHLNMPDRKSLGWISRNEVFNAVRARLERDGHFPPNAAGVGRAVYEGPQIQRSGDGRFMGINQRAPACNPWVVAESVQSRFDSQDAVVNWYIDAEWGSCIDGIPFTS